MARGQSLPAVYKPLSCQLSFTPSIINLHLAPQDHPTLGGTRIDQRGQLPCIVGTGCNLTAIVLSLVKLLNLKTSTDLYVSIVDGTLYTFLELVSILISMEGWCIIVEVLVSSSNKVMFVLLPKITIICLTSKNLNHETKPSIIGLIDIHLF